MTVKYHEPRSCNKCKGENKLIKTYYDSGCLHESETECIKCGFKDFWAHGFFESAQSVGVKCETYSFK